MVARIFLRVKRRRHGEKLTYKNYSMINNGAAPKKAKAAHDELLAWAKEPSRHNALRAAYRVIRHMAATRAALAALRSISSPAALLAPLLPTAPRRRRAYRLCAAHFIMALFSPYLSISLLRTRRQQRCALPRNASSWRVLFLKQRASTVLPSRAHWRIGVSLARAHALKTS